MFLRLIFVTVTAFVSSDHAEALSCGGAVFVATGHTDTINSPGHPLNYPPNSNCVWEVHTSIENRLMFNSVAFSLEKHNNCSFDYLKIEENDDTNRTASLGRFCVNGPSGILTTRNYAKLTFRSDNNRENTGFIIHVATAFPNVTISTSFHTAKTTTSPVASCGGHLFVAPGQNDVIKSPGHPASYPANTNCAWEVYTSIGSVLEFSWITFNLEACNNCACDYLEFTENSSTNGTVSLGTICATNGVPGIKTSRNYAKLTFRSDSTQQYTGFIIGVAAPFSVVSTLTTSVPTVKTTTSQSGRPSEKPSVPPTKFSTPFLRSPSTDYHTVLTTASTPANNSLCPCVAPITFQCRRGVISASEEDLENSDATAAVFDSDNSNKCRSILYNVHQWIVEKAQILSRMQGAPVVVDCRKGQLHISDIDVDGSSASKLHFNSTPNPKCQSILHSFLQFLSRL